MGGAAGAEPGAEGARRITAQTGGARVVVFLYGITRIGNQISV